jgi:hypothetical protein
MKFISVVAKKSNVTLTQILCRFLSLESDKKIKATLAHPYPVQAFYVYTDPDLGS